MFNYFKKDDFHVKIELMSFCLKSISRSVNASSYSLFHRYKSTIPEIASQYPPVLIKPIKESSMEGVCNKTNNSIKVGYPEDKMKSNNGPRFEMLLTKESFSKAVSYIYDEDERHLNTSKMWDRAQSTGIIKKVKKAPDDH